jgi:hypothetical protein
MGDLRHAGCLVMLLVGCSSGDIGAADQSDDANVDDSAFGEAAVDRDGAADVTDAVTRPDGEADAADADDARSVPPDAPPCPTGDRTEWSGAVPGTAIALSVCSACGESYVVAASGSASAVDVTVDNGTTSITATVPAHGKVTSTKIADKASDGSVTVCATEGGVKGCLPVSPKNEKYCDPYRAITKLRPERIDQGVDYGGSGPIYAMGPGTIDVWRNRSDSGWPGGTFMSYKLTAGPAAGKTIYLAENIDLDPKLKTGSYVYNGTVLGTLVNASPDSESGWGVPGAGYTAEYSCYVENCSTPLGINFNELLVCLKTPSGVNTGSTGCCPAVSGYPSSWCPLIDKWQ